MNRVLREQMRALKLMPAILLMAVLTGCHSSAHPPGGSYQRFVLVPNPSEIRKDIPVGALALDTKTGQLCYTVGGPFTSEVPALDMCATLYENHP